MAPFHSDVPYGTLDLLVLHTLRRSGPLHGYGLARRIEEAAAGAVTLNQGTIHPALVRLEDKGWIRSRWGMSEHNRRARFYALTPAGRRQLTGEVARWRKTVAMIERVLRDGRR